MQLIHEILSNIHLTPAKKEVSVRRKFGIVEYKLLGTVIVNYLLSTKLIVK